jgi:hypothetical protein
MGPFLLLTVWFAGMLEATWLGYDRGRSRTKFESWVGEIERQVASEDLRLAEGLEALAAQIDRADNAGGEHNEAPPALHPWPGRLEEKAERVRNSSSARQEI